MRTRQCPDCGFEAGFNEATCPQCGRSLAPATSPRQETDAAVDATVDAMGSPSASAHPMPRAGSSADRPSGTRDASSRPQPPLPSYADPAYYEALAQSSARPDATPTTDPWDGRSAGASYAAARRTSRREAWLRGAWLRQLVVPLVLLALVVVALLYTAPGLLARLRVPLASSASASPTATVPTTANGEIILYRNPLNTATIGWEHQDGCTFRADGLHVTDGFTCFAPMASGGVADVHAVVTVKQVAGPDDRWNDIAIRASYSNDAYLLTYLFGFQSNGYWGFDKCTAASHICTPLVRKANNHAVHHGLNAENTLDISARGTHFAFVINGVPIGTFDDSTYTGGMVGMSGDQGSETVYSNLTISRPK